MRHRRRTSAVLPRRTASGVAHVAAALMPRTETIVASSGLTNREVWSLSRRGRLTFDSGKLSPNQRTVNRPLVGGRLVLFVVLFRLRHYRFFWALDRLRLLRFLNRFVEQLFVLLNRPGDVVRLMLIVDYSLGRSGGDGRQDGWRLGFLPLAWHARMFVFVVRVTRRA